MKCDICGRDYDTEGLADIFGNRVCLRCLKCIAATETGSLIYDYYLGIFKNTLLSFRN